MQKLVENLRCLREVFAEAFADFLGTLDVLEFRGLIELFINDRVQLEIVRKNSLSKTACAYGLAKADD